MGRGKPANAGLDYAFDVGNVDAVARNLGTVNVDLHARLAQFPHHRQLGESGNLRQDALDLDGLVLEHL